MKNQIFITAISFIFWNSLHALTTPSYPSLYLPSSLNASTLRTSGFPTQYDVSVETLERGHHPMPETAFYMTLLAAMYDLSRANQQRPQPAFRTWEVPTYNARVAVRADRVRFGVYGLLSAALQGASAGFWPMVLEMRWDGVGVGRIDIAYRTSRLGVGDEDAGWVGMNGSSSTSMRVGSGVEVAGVRYDVRPSGRSVAVGRVFQVALQTLVVVAEAGCRTAFRLLRLVGLGFVFVAEFDARGRSLMDHGDLSGVVTFLATDMVARGSFQEVDVSVVKDGVVVGHGNLRGP